jgi:hypothetical protein
MILNPSPGLSVVTAELSAVVRQRRAVIQMKKYLRLCRLASSDRLLRYRTYQAAARRHPDEEISAALPPRQLRQAPQVPTYQAAAQPGTGSTVAEFIDP